MDWFWGLMLFPPNVHACANRSMVSSYKVLHTMYGLLTSLIILNSSKSKLQAYVVSNMDYRSAYYYVLYRVMYFNLHMWNISFFIFSILLNFTDFVIKLLFCYFLWILLVIYYLQFSVFIVWNKINYFYNERDVWWIRLYRPTGERQAEVKKYILETCSNWLFLS